MIAGIVLAGGAGRRMGGIDKAALLVGGVPLLDRVLAAARPVCERLVVVGPVRATAVGEVRFVTEPAPGGGPVPAVQAGLGLVGRVDAVVVLAGDLPLLADQDVRRLVAALPVGPEGAAAAADRSGPNPLLAAHQSPGLQARVARLGPGTPATLLLPPEPAIVDLGAAALNVNRPADLAVAQALVRLDQATAAVAHRRRELLLAAVPGAAETVDEVGTIQFRDAAGRVFCTLRTAPGDLSLTVRGGDHAITDVPADATDEEVLRLVRAALATPPAY